MKKLIACIIAVLMVFSAAAFAAEFPDLSAYSVSELDELRRRIAAEAAKRIFDKDSATPAEEFFYASNGEMVRINSYQGNSEHIVIPDTLDDVPVCLIGRGAFENAKAKTISIPDSVTEMGEDCLRGSAIPCPLILPASLAETDYYIALNSSFTGVIIQSDAPFYTWAFCNSDAQFLYIREGCAPRFLSNCFDMCGDLEIAVIPPSVTEIADNTFEASPLLKIITTPGSYAEEYAKRNFIRCETDTYEEYVLLYESMYFGK